MPDDLLDIERLRTLWTRSPEETGPVVHPVLAQVEAAADPTREAHEVLERIRLLALLCFPDQRPSLEAFFGELLGQLDAHERSQGKGQPLAALEVTLNRLEDLLEVFLLLSSNKTE